MTLSGEGTLSVSTGGGGARSRHYMSSEHLWSAEYDATACRELETRYIGVKHTDPEHRSHAISAVFSSVLFLESLVNETYLDAADTVHVSGRSANLSAQTRADIASAWVGSLNNGFKYPLTKYQRALEVAGAKTFDIKVPPYKDVDLLIQLRNHLVHFQPAWQDGTIVEDWEKELSVKVPVSGMLPSGAEPWFPLAVLGAGLAEWALAVAEALADEWTSRLGIVPVYKTDLRT